MNRNIDLFGRNLEALYYFDTAYWDNGTNEMSDQSGHERHATASGEPSVGVEGPHAFEAAEFVTDDDFWVDQSLVKTAPLSMFVFTQPNQNSSPTEVCGTHDIGSHGWGLSQDGGGSTYYFYIMDSSGTKYTVSGGPAATEEWASLNLVYDGETAVSYRDGMVHNRQDVPNLNTQADFAIGTSPNGRHYDGRVAVTAVWSRVLSEDEVHLLNRITAARRSIA